MALVSNLVLALLVVILMTKIKPSLCQTTDQLMEKICRSTEDYGFCKSTFQGRLKSPNADIVALTQITIEAASDQATQTHEFIRQTIDTTTDPGTKNALTECENAYGLITQAFGSAAVSFFQKDYTSVENSERITPRAEASCETSMSTPPNQQPHILDERSRQMRILIGMSVVSVQELLQPRSIKTVAAPAPM